MQKVMVDMGEIFPVRNAMCSNTVVETMQLVFGHLDNLCVTGIARLAHYILSWN